jgi:hypothetical protein
MKAKAVASELPCRYTLARVARGYYLLAVIFLNFKSSSLLKIIRGPTDVGMQRLTLTDSNKKARDWIIETI